MATYIGIGFSKTHDTLEAAREAAAQAIKELRHDRIDIAIVFSTNHYDPQIFLPVVYEILDQTKIIGSSTSGIILGDRIENRGIGILTLNSEELRFETGSVSHLNLQDMQEAGMNLSQGCTSDYGRSYRKMFIVFTDGQLKDIAGLVTGIKNEFGPTFPVIGAGSSDDHHFFKTYQFLNNKYMTQSAVGLMIGGKLDIGMSCRHGWKPLGKPRTINKTEGNIIKSIDGKKAKTFYDEYFQEEAKTLNIKTLGQIKLRYPLGVHGGEKNDYILRNVLSTLDDGSVVCQDAVDPDAQVHIMIGNKDFCLQAAQEAAQDVRKQLNGKKPKMALILESFTRYKLLEEEVGEEIKTIKKVLGDPPVLGMYSCNEIFDYVTEKKEHQVRLHNGSIIIIAIG